MQVESSQTPLYVRQLLDSAKFRFGKSPLNFGFIESSFDQMHVKRMRIAGGKDLLKKMRDIDDKLVYALNCSIPTPSHRGEVNDPTTNCKQLYETLSQNHITREKAIRNCIEVTSARVQELKATRDSDPAALKAFNKELTKLRLMKSELNVEEVVQDRSNKLYYERCRDFFKPSDLNVS